jgi:sigma-B regulation protein RsbU (phosphoserine phosphatase)
MGQVVVVKKEELSQISFKRGLNRRFKSVAVDLDRRVEVDDRRHQGLAWLSLFKNSNESAVIEAIGDSEILVLEAGATLLRPGEPNESVFLILAGKLGAHLGDSQNPESVIPMVAGDCLGELSAIDGKPVSALVKAVTKSRVLRLSQDVFWNRLMAVPGVARNLLGVLANRMRRNTEVMLDGQRKQIELEYIRQELDVARQLQIGMLPMRRPWFPDRQDLEIAGMMEAASSIGGDLFDAFFVDDQRLFFCIGDVSGHGIPAAMFMARAISLMRIAAFADACPAALLARINEQLCAGNDANMFVTLFCGFLEVATGRIVYSNGGHLAPLHWRDGKMTPLPIPKGTIIGVIPGGKYIQSEVVLNQGDFLLCFTDGVSEAQTAAGEEYSESRLLNVVEAIASHPLESVLSHVRIDVADFSGDSKLADDCTMLAIRKLSA